MRHLSLLLLSVPVLTWGATLDEVLAKLDQGAAKFSSITGGISRVTYTKVIDDKAVEEGSIALKKTGSKDLQVLIRIDKPDAKTVAFRGGKAEIFYPKLKTVQEYDLGKRTGLIDQFLLVGFGTTGRDLKSNYEIKLVGQEMVSGENAYRLDLTPTSKAMLEQFRKLELWIVEGGAYPVQQKFTQPSGDYYLFTYNNVKLNPPLGDDALKLNLPKGVKREYPQK